MFKFTQTPIKGLFVIDLDMFDFELPQTFELINFQYLIGHVIKDGEKINHHYLWADR